MDWILLFLVAIAGISIVCLVIYTWIRGRRSRIPRVVPDEPEQVASEPAAQFDEGTDKPSRDDLGVAQIASEPRQEEQQEALSHLDAHLPAGTEQTQQTRVETTQEEKSRAERRRPKPNKRGGRHRGQTTKSGKQEPKQESMRAPKPEIACWRRQTEWVLGVEVPDEIAPDSELKVSQNGASLQHVSCRGRCWQLENVSGKVTVVGHEGVLSEIALGEEPYLVFKLTGSDLGQGRHVKSISAGKYLVVVPQDWERHKDSGPPPVEPEYVVIEGFRAHFFILERGLSESIVFETADGVLNRIRTERPRFELVGNRYDDGGEDIGPLFLQELPRIRGSNKQLWARISTVIVGEEGPGRGRWRAFFKPTPESREQILPTEIAMREAGWFFLRFYDDNDDLVESLDFRFAKGLEKVVLSTSSPLPGPEGHSSALVEFHHNSNYVVLPLCDAAKSLQITCQERRTTVEIPPDPRLDRTQWEVGPRDGAKVRVTVLVERMWWALCSEDRKPEQWQDKRLELSTEDMAAASQKAIWLRLPKRRWIEASRVGFEYSGSRRYKLKVNETEVVIPLREFGDFDEVRATTQELPLMVWIERENQRVDCVLAVLPPQSPTASQEAASASVSEYRWLGLGRKKSAFARAAMRPGKGRITINSQDYREYFSRAPVGAKQFLDRLLEMDPVREVVSRVDVEVAVQGSSPMTNRQAKAVAHALARVLIRYDQSLKPTLKVNGFGGVNVKNADVRPKRRL